MQRSSTDSHPYWLNVPLIRGETYRPQPSSKIAPSIIIVGSGLSGISAGYFLLKKGFENVWVIDDQPEAAASYRNCGHILYGTVESMKAMTEIHGPEKARDLWAFSIEICDLIPKTLTELQIDADYRRDGYLVISIDEVEDRECRESVELLNQAGFQSDYWPAEKVREHGFKSVFGARYERGSAQAHPVKFRNGLVRAFQQLGGTYYSGLQVSNIQERSDGVSLQLTDGTSLEAEATVIAANAYSPLFSGFFRENRLIEPFRGQILASQPLKRHQFPVRFPHSFDHGYEYALISEDNRLILGGWRQNSETREVGTYSLETNPQIEEGLAQFAKDHYQIAEEFQWEYSWSGIMAASKTGLPFIGPTHSPRIFACAGYTGHGFSWAHGSAKLLADIIAGDPLPSVAPYFNPKASLVR
jgi:gamma-glutamylputrescine oxidase